MEADLQQFYNVDYRDRWRYDEHGNPRLTFRRLWNLVTQLPPESRLAQLDRMHWTIEAQLIDDVRMALTGSEKHPPQPHPQRPTAGKQRRQHRPEVVADARRRSRERQRMIDNGEIT